MTEQKSFVTSGKRKTSIAKATLRPGKGIIRINSQLLDTIGNDFTRMKLKEPMMLAEPLSNKVNISIKVKGGGFQSQTEASRLAIAKALLNYSNNSMELKKKFLDYDRHLLVADVRRKEMCKPNDSKARAKRQKSYR
ncbi:MAG: 30S ribosomal protein S9 [Candidatus Nanoarchaeia archaeon]|nr:30S ribosomal protein S9 [Candidatus Nanoarchaeia archaeon]